MGILTVVLWILLAVVMFLLLAVILLQEGKGGGLAEAFGGAGAETFGVKATGIDRFTAICGGLFLLLAVTINLCMRQGDDTVIAEPSPSSMPSNFTPPPIPAESSPQNPAPAGAPGSSSTDSTTKPPGDSGRGVPPESGEQDGPSK